MKDVSYSVGMSVAGSLIQQDLGEIDPMVFAEAIKDVFEGKELRFSPEEANQHIQEYVQEMSEAKYEEHKKAGEAFLEKNKTKAGVEVTASGLQYEVIQPGTGKKPGAQDTVEVHYHGTLIDGTVFDSSIQRGTPASFGVSQVIRGWTEALQLMNEGAKYRLYIPQELAYGANPHPGGPIKPFMTLVFDVELLAVR
ncbi:MAG: FKBP-type peptidyl-prolyl cis-trans isomerase [Bacteroidetes bacterium]|nr:MAG: FKBP-type peptidyl-prolyl cis-trans isomerase [Bacteroidota bacterium]